MYSHAAEKFLDLSVAENVARFVKNVVDARDNGYEDCCVFCGVGVQDESDTHELFCPCRPQDEWQAFVDHMGGDYERALADSIAAKQEP